MNTLNYTIATVVFILSSITPIRAQETVQIHFEAPPNLGGPGSILFQEYYENNLWFFSIAGTDGFVRRWPGNPLFPDNGSIAYLQATSGDSLMFGLVGGTIFDLFSVDLAEYSTVVPNAVTVRFIGYRQDGSSVATDLTTDGIFDGTGPIADFQTFQFGPEWSGLSRVEIPTSVWSLDNLVVSIPEPSTWALLLVGGGMVCVFRSRRRK